MLLRSLCSLLLVAVAVTAQGPTADQKPLHVHVIGASVSGGFKDGPMTGAKEVGDTVPLQQVLKAWCGDHARATTHGLLQMQMMFMSPIETGEMEVKQAKRAKADILVAIDFLFWFAYGYIDGNNELEERSALLKKGLTMLEDFDVPLLIGDLPDMTGAERRMLSPQQIPSPAVLKQLNDQIAAWAKARKNVQVAGLAKLVKSMKVDGAVLPLADGPKQTLPGALQQADHLHATRLGMAFLGYSIQPMLRQMFPVGHPLHDQQWTMEQFIEATGAGGEMDTLRAVGAGKVPAKETAGAGK